jgi:hypothetical protein
MNLYKNLNYQNLNISDLIKFIKETTSELLNLKGTKNIFNKERSRDYKQLENYTKKLENDIKILYRKFFDYKIHNDALEEKIKLYRIVQEKYEELKEKVKYVGGKFLDNERKDNEIIILREENTILKKEIAKLEKINKLNDALKNNYLNKTKNLQNEIEHLNKKLESKYNSNNSISNYNSSNASIINNMNNNDNILSRLISKHDFESANLMLSNNSSRKKNYNCLKGFQNIFQKNTLNNKRPSNYNIIKNIYMNSNNSIKNYINSSTVNTINTNIFTINYNKLVHNVSQSRKNNSKKKYKKNVKKNNSMSMKIDKEEEKSLSVNKYLKNFNDSKFMYKSDYKNKKDFNKIINFKSNDSFPFSCQHKSSAKIKKSYHNSKIKIQKKYNEFKMKKSNSALNIKVSSK